MECVGVHTHCIAKLKDMVNDADQVMVTNATLTTIEPQAATVALPGGGAMSTLRYSGFDQRDNIRYYVFQYRVGNQKPRPIVVSADIPLLVKHHVRIQDGPDLCLRTLTLEISGFDLSQAGALQRVLTAEDLLAYLASRPAPAAKSKRAKRTDGETNGLAQ